MRVLACFAVFFVAKVKYFCTGQFVWPVKAADVMFGIQCDAPDPGFTIQASRSSPGAFYKAEAVLTHEAAVRVCARSGKSHLPMFRTQEEYDVILDAIARSGKPLWLGLYVPPGSSCSDLQSCQGILRWHDNSLFLSGSFSIGSFGSLENVDSSTRSCLLMGTDGKIQSPSNGCVDGVAKTLCQHDCPGPKLTLGAEMCPPSRESFTVVNSTDYSVSFPASNALRRKPHCDDGDNRDHTIYWATPHLGQGDTAHILLDVGCAFEATTVVLRNAPNRVYQNGGSSQFKLLVTASLEEEWTEVVMEELPDMRGVSCSEQFDSVFEFPPTMARYVMFQSLSIYVNGGHAALQYLDVY